MPISPGDIARVFDAARIKELGKLARLPEDADLDRFGCSLRWAVGNYIKRTAEPTPNQLRREIEKLHKAAELREYETLSRLIEHMTPPARRLIEDRRKAVAHVVLGHTTRVPDIHEPAAFRDPARREIAAGDLLSLVKVGARFHEKKRPSGRPSISLLPVLHAPQPSRAEPRREAERELVMFLLAAVAETGAAVPQTARTGDAGRTIGPAAKMIATVLRLAGAWGEAGSEGKAVRLINDLHARRRRMESRDKPPTD